MATEIFPVQKTDAEWAAELTPEQFRVLRQHGTERPGTSPLNGETGDGIFSCAGWDHQLFPAETKYKAAAGGPVSSPPCRPQSPRPKTAATS